MFPVQGLSVKRDVKPEIPLSNNTAVQYYYRGESIQVMVKIIVGFCLERHDQFRTL